MTKITTDRIMEQSCTTKDCRNSPRRGPSSISSNVPRIDSSVDASTAVLPDDPAVEDDLSAISSKPTGAVLCYPVISAGDKGHQGSFENLLGHRYPADKDAFSLENRVDEHTAPCFLWHTAEDDGVPFENSLMMAAALHAKGVQTELHVFPFGEHGVGLATNGPAGVDRWAPLSAQWIKTF